MLAPEGEPEGRERQETKRSQVLTAISAATLPEAWVTGTFQFTVNKFPLFFRSEGVSFSFRTKNILVDRKV